MYEADPRHVDLLVQSLGLTSANALSTPGVKDPVPDYDAVKHNEDDAAIMADNSVIDSDAIINSLKTPESRVSFSENVETFEVPAYSTIFELHPLISCGHW